MKYSASAIIFQLTPSRRATTVAAMEGYLASISTHALTEGDRFYIERRYKVMYFNSRPHGGRQTIQILDDRVIHFNSRPHGGRLHNVITAPPRQIFQLTPSRRATFFIGKLWDAGAFQLTPSRRATLRNFLSDTEQSFQLTPSRRATVRSDIWKYELYYFNSRPHGGRHISFTD